MQLTVPRAVTLAVAMLAIICAIHFNVSLVFITYLLLFYVYHLSFIHYHLLIARLKATASNVTSVVAVI